MERQPLPFAALDSWGNFLGAHCADSLTDERGALKFLECLLSCRGRYSPIPVWRPQVQRFAPVLASPSPTHRRHRRVWNARELVPVSTEMKTEAIVGTAKQRLN